MIKGIKEFFTGLLGEKHEIVESINESIEDRSSSPFYGYFITSWLIVNWKIVYVALFINQEILYEKTGLLKNEYLLEKILPMQYTFDWIVTFILLPFILTVVIFWFMPVITHKFYRKYIKNIIRMKTIKLEETTAKKQAETKLIEVKVKQAEIEKKAKSVSPEILWEREYEKFKKNILFPKFETIKESIYERNSKTKIIDHFDDIKFQIDTSMLVYADSNDILNIRGDTISLTAKGKYFMKLYSEK